jgi:ADP-ribose pyrophosphatase
MAWKTKSSKSVYKNRWMEVTEDVVESDSGKEMIFGIIHKKPFALIVPWDGKYITLVGQYRYSVDYFSWEFPMGHFEEHASIAETAKEELEEETGLRAEKIEEVANFFLAPGHHDQVCHMFLATGLVEGQQKLEDAEAGMEVKKVTVEELRKMIKDGEIKDSPTIAAFGIIVAQNLLE